jgi:hypothetical protein
MILYDTLSYPDTYVLYYDDHRLCEFRAKIVAVLKNVQ